MSKHGDRGLEMNTGDLPRYQVEQRPDGEHWCILDTYTVRRYGTWKRREVVEGIVTESNRFMEAAEYALYTTTWQRGDDCVDEDDE